MTEAQLDLIRELMQACWKRDERLIEALIIKLMFIVKDK